VKHPPIKEPPPSFRRAADQLVAIRLHQDERKHASHFTEKFKVLTIQPGAPVDTITLEPEPVCLVSPADLQVNTKRFFSRTNQFLQLRCSERPAARKQVKGFKQTGFSGSVITVEKVSGLVGRNLDGPEVAEVFQPE